MKTQRAILKYVLVFICAFSGVMLLNARGAVQVTRLDPPLVVSAWQETDGPEPINTVAVDFNLDGRVDFRIGYGFSWVTSFFSSPTRIVIKRHFYPWTTNIFGSTGALPLRTLVGSNLISAVDTNVYIWHTGDTNTDPEIQSYGDRRATAVVVLDPGIIGVPPTVSGGMPNKEAIIGVEFLIGTNLHYGYVHFDFRKEIGWWGGSGGYILGWAYETEPNTPILAEPLAVPPTPFSVSIHKQPNGVFDLIWRGTPGATYRVQGTPALHLPFTDLIPDLVPSGGPEAFPTDMVTTFSGLEQLPAYYWRLVRTR